MTNENSNNTNPKKIKQDNTGALAEFVKQKSQSIFDFIISRFSVVEKEINLIRGKSKNLLQTNYDLGLKHLEKGNLSDAIFRFKFIKKFWPHHLDAHYQLAYCYFLKKNFQQTQIILKELVSLDPSYQKKADELLDKIKNPELNNN